MNKLVIFYLIMTIAFIGCSSTKPQSGSLTGTVSLQGLEDHSEIVIGIYELTELDLYIVEANTEWSHIGVKINQHTEFDHRFGTLVKTGETDASGNFEITDIPTGVYNIVAIKDGFGFRYIYEISISEGDNDISKSDIILYPETTITSDISIPTTFESYHHYIIEEDIIVDDELTIEPRTVIRLNDGKEITSYGTFNAVGEYENFIWFTKNDGFSENLNTIEPDSNYFWERVTLEEHSHAQAQWCKFDWANIGLLNYVNGFEISNCIFRNCNCGFKTENVDSTFCSNLLCQFIGNEEQGGILFENVLNGFIGTNIAFGSYNGIKTKEVSNIKLNNNYLINNTNGMFISWESNPIIKYNEFQNNEWAINMIVRSKPEILRNNICGDNGILLGHGPQTYDQNQPTIHYNNLDVGSWIIKYKDTNDLDIDATNNYFFTTSSEEISEKIYDYYDNPNGVYPYEYGIALYEPFLISKILNCGIE